MKSYLNKIYVFLLFLISVLCTAQAQNIEQTDSYKIIRSNLGIGGTSKMVSTTHGQYIVSHSIGQSSVIGTSSKNGYYLRQGYQQPHTSFKVEKSRSNNIKATVYPNPFNQDISVVFNEEMTDIISVSIYDIGGKLVYVKDFSPSKRIQLNLKNFSNGSYLLKAVSNGKLFNSKLIKI